MQALQSAAMVLTGRGAVATWRAAAAPRGRRRSAEYSHPTQTGGALTRHTSQSQMCR